MVDNRDATTLVPRQIWATPSRTTSVIHTANSLTTTANSSAAQPSLCSIALPAGGILQFNESFSLLLESNVGFESSCDDPLHSGANSGNSTVINISGDPFYASVAPQIYALATATIISYILVILIFITPRTFYVGGPGGGANFLGLRSLVPGSGSSSVIGVGRRPLLQKIAAITVAVSLTIATADTFIVAERQYYDGLMDSNALVEEVIGSTEIRVVRVVSDTFLWLAQVQTLIRLFPRHKEKVTIKWLGFALVTCDTVFSILENFVSQTTLTRPRSFRDAIPALGYLFQMSISLIYASCVIYYSLSKRRFAFWHSKMKNIFLVAILSLASVLIPVTFFVLDISQPKIATWGEYIRWVGAAAASVVVWEWVERIEGLERDERKDGILGREIFDGDEMLEMGSDSGDGNGSSTYFGFGKRRGNNDEEKKFSMFPMSGLQARMPFGKRRPSNEKPTTRKDERRKSHRHRASEATVVGDITRPPQAATPISRSDTTSAASTVYAVRYQNVSSPSPAIPEEPEDFQQSRQVSVQVNTQLSPLAEAENLTLASKTNQDTSAAIVSQTDPAPTETQVRDRQAWSAVPNPFKRKRAEPPAEVAAQMAASNIRRSPAQTYHNIRDRYQAYRASQRNARAKPAGPSSPAAVTIIPAQQRGNHLALPDDVSRTSARQSVEEETSTRERRSVSSRVSRNRRASREVVPVMIIPAPTRGARTWSPDDMSESGSGSRTSSQQHSSLGQVAEQPESSTPTPTPADIVTARGALTITESPARTRLTENRDIPSGSGSPVASRTSLRFRTPPIDSLDDRINSATPVSVVAASTEHVFQNRNDSTESQSRRLHDSSITPISSPGNAIRTPSTPDLTRGQERSLVPQTSITEAQDTPPPRTVRDGHSRI